MLLVLGLLIILIMVRMYQTDYLQSYSPFVDTRYSLKGQKETPEQYIFGGCLFINALLIFQQFHMSRVFSSDSNKKSYDPCYFVIVYSVLISYAFRKNVKFQLLAQRIKIWARLFKTNDIVS